MNKNYKKIHYLCIIRIKNRNKSNEIIMSSITLQIKILEIKN